MGHLSRDNSSPSDSGHRRVGPPLEEGKQVAPFIEKIGRKIHSLKASVASSNPKASIFASNLTSLVVSKPSPSTKLNFDICIFHPQLANAIRLVAQCPNVQFVLDHIGKPDIKNQLFDPWQQEIRTLAEFPNVYCKISGLVTEADHGQWTPAHLQPYIEHVITCFGFDRVIYGSDWPVSTQATDYPRWVHTLQEAVSGCSPEEVRNLFHDNAIKCYRLPA